jgi:hypothetical protein
VKLGKSNGEKEKTIDGKKKKEHKIADMKDIIHHNKLNKKFCSILFHSILSREYFSF